jgi:hypothetical protein
MSDKLKFQRDFPEVCDLWKNFDHRARYTADNMMHAYCAGYAARAESIADQPAETETDPLTRGHRGTCRLCGLLGMSGFACAGCGRGRHQYPAETPARGTPATGQPAVEHIGARGTPACCADNLAGVTCDCAGEVGK